MLIDPIVDMATCGVLWYRWFKRQLQKMSQKQVKPPQDKQTAPTYATTTHEEKPMPKVQLADDTQEQQQHYYTKSPPMTPCPHRKLIDIECETIPSPPGSPMSMRVRLNIYERDQFVYCDQGGAAIVFMRETYRQF